MGPNKMFLVMLSIGEYSDRQECAVFVTFDNSTGMMAVEQIEALRREFENETKDMKKWKGDWERWCEARKSFAKKLRNLYPHIFTDKWEPNRIYADTFSIDETTNSWLAEVELR